MVACKKNKPYRCDICGCRYGDAHALQKHTGVCSQHNYHKLRDIDFARRRLQIIHQVTTIRDLFFELRKLCEEYHQTTYKTFQVVGKYHTNVGDCNNDKYVIVKDGPIFLATIVVRSESDDENSFNRRSICTTVPTEPYPSPIYISQVKTFNAITSIDIYFYFNDLPNLKKDINRAKLKGLMDNGDVVSIECTRAMQYHVYKET